MKTEPVVDDLNLEQPDMVRSGFSRFRRVLVLVAIICGLLAGVLAYRFQFKFYTGTGGKLPNNMEFFLRAFGLESTGKPGEMSSSQLVQIIADAINNNITITEAYKAIPNSQLGEIDMDSFYSYISLMRNACSGSQVSFLPMSLSEKERELASIAEIVPTEAVGAQAERNGRNRYFSLHTESMDKHLPLIIMDDAEGKACLSKDWINNSLKLYRHAEIYFSIINRGNVTALSKLQTSALENQSTRDRRAQKTIEYYETSVSGSFSEYEIVSWRSDSIVFRQKLKPYVEPNYTSYDINAGLGLIKRGKDDVSRYVQVMLDATGEFQYRDIIPEKCSEADFYFTNTDNTLGKIGVGNLVTSDQLKTLWGELLSKESVLNNNSFKRRYQLVYAQARISLAEVNFLADGTFSGELEAMILTTSNCSLAESGLRVGSSLEELLTHYPYIDMTGYIIVDDDGGRFISFIVQDKTVKAIRLADKNTLAPELEQRFNPDYRSSGAVLPAVVVPSHTTSAPTTAPTATAAPVPATAPAPTPAETTVR